MFSRGLMLYKVTLFLLIFSSIASKAEDNQDLKNDILFLKIQELEAEIAELRNKVESQNFLIEKLISLLPQIIEYKSLSL